MVMLWCSHCRRSEECHYWSCPGSPVRGHKTLDNWTNAVQNTLKSNVHGAIGQLLTKQTNKGFSVLCHVLPSRSSRGSGAASVPSPGTSSAARSWPDDMSAMWIRCRRRSLDKTGNQLEKQLKNFVFSGCHKFSILHFASDWNKLKFQIKSTLFI